MRKYRGKHPSLIRSVSGTYAPGIALIETNEGGKYFLSARATEGRMPQLGEDIYALPFDRAQPMLFRQEVSRFNRILDGEEWPFVEYPALLNPSVCETLERFEQRIRRQFIQDMARQNILPRFK